MSLLIASAVSHPVCRSLMQKPWEAGALGGGILKAVRHCEMLIWERVAKAASLAHK